MRNEDVGYNCLDSNIQIENMDDNISKLAK